ncbi:MAG: rod shape-determining protein RodA [Thermoflavifilum sp.]|nr:rod shape-determining protein RodA [Thermoflavifilum sp.]
MESYRHTSTELIKPGVDKLLIALYLLLVIVGWLSIFAVEHRAGEDVLYHMMHLSRNYSRQLMWVGISMLLALVVLLVDSRIFPALANLMYAFGIMLLLVVLVAGKDIKGSHSWLVIGGFQFQPAEFTKLTTNLALAKYLSRLDVDFSTLRSRLIAIGLIALPAAIIILQSETGLALVYLSFFLALYREGLPGIILIIGFSAIVLVLSSLLVEKHLLLIIFSIAAAIVIYLMRRSFRRHPERLLLILLIWGFCSVFVMQIVPYIFTHVLKPYQVTRINVMLGKASNPQSSYNVLQSKIAIGSGGFWGKGYLKGTQTRYEFVPEQSTDFIFCTVGEDFGFVGSMMLLGIYLIMLFRIIQIAERQRSTFSRVYAYGVAGVVFFHVVINIGMTVGLAPVIGIPLPWMSYGGSSMITFTLLLFVLIRLDADRQKILR